MTLSVYSRYSPHFSHFSDDVATSRDTAFAKISARVWGTQLAFENQTPHQITLSVAKRINQQETLKVQ